MFAPRKRSNKISVRSTLKIMSTRSRVQLALASICFLKTGDSTFIFLTYNHLKIGNRHLTTSISLKGPENL